MRRRVASMQASMVGMVLSQVASTTRNLLHANQAQNSTVSLPATVGPFPQSNWSHIPGSGTQGR